MMKKENLSKDKQSERSELIVFVLVILWVFIISVFAQLLEWLMEQTLFESTTFFPDVRWLIHLSYTVLVSLPLFITSFISQSKSLKVIFNFWGIISASGYFLTQGRFTLINQANLVSIFQIVGIILFLGILIISKRNQMAEIRNFVTYDNSIRLVVGYIAILIIPWVLWGALGSFFDTVLNFLAAISVSALFLYIYKYFFLEKIRENREISNTKNFNNGLIIFIGLVIVSTTFGQNGQQWLLILTIPFSAWLISSLSNAGDQNRIGSAFLLLSSIVALPLCWFDPDELTLLIGTQKGEIFSWVNQIIFSTILILLFLTALNKKIIHKTKKNLKPGIWQYLPFVWIISLGLYFFAGQPGFFGESYLLVFEQFDQFSVLQSKNDKNSIYSELVNYAEESQKEIKEILNFWHIEYQPYYLVNAIEVKSGPLLRYYFSRNENIAQILDSPNLRPLPKNSPPVSGSSHVVETELWNLESLGVNQVWEKYNVKGEGIIVGQADSGVDGQHPQLREQYLGFNSDNQYRWLDPWNLTDSPIDTNGHGTHTLGIILGKETGIAPEANWIGCVNLARNFGNPGYYIECLQFLFAPYPQNGDPFSDGRPELGANIINNSWSCPIVEGCNNELFDSAVKILRTSGVFMVASNGNDGYYGCESTHNPLAIYDEVTSVGAIDRFGELAQFSSLGPVNYFGKAMIKPDLLAPGVDIFSTMPNGTYGLMSGTSAAGPHVAGVVALIWSANPELIGDIDRTEEILFSTSESYNGIVPSCISDMSVPNNASGYGIVNALKAVEASLNMK